ncbi:unnamed protein product [Heterotrigona itama]|uniref:Uncharacterized protein n=1 Tax=Heterotrigona itama TaxID=395501 RepID=A0A6V7HAF7_9HYME|nr:unnamed protein product [Heterotrigona itama]
MQSFVHTSSTCCARCKPPSLAAGAPTYLSFSNLPDDTSSGRARSIRGSSTARPVETEHGLQLPRRRLRRRGEGGNQGKGTAAVPRTQAAVLQRIVGLLVRGQVNLFDFACVMVFNMRCLGDDSADDGR